MSSVSSLLVSLAKDAKDRSYPIIFNKLGQIGSTISNSGLLSSKIIIITDQNVSKLYGDTVERSLTKLGANVNQVVLPAGEETKSLHNLSGLYDHVLPLGINRKTTIIALGGGVIGDLAGILAATLLRGLPLIQVPTSLIAQTDSSIGGKTGINHKTGKNLIGAFYQPKLVFIDDQLLLTLPNREWIGGLAEVVKHALITDAVFFDFLVANLSKILNRDPEILAYLIQTSAKCKVDIVMEDEQELGRRALLNFGHTFGHALEICAGYGTFSHGEAVFIGMKAALYLSRHLTENNSFNHAQYKKSIDFLNQFPVPLIPKDIEIQKLIETMKFDKKATDTSLNIIAVKQIGEAFVTASPGDAALRSAWASVGAI